MAASLQLCLLQGASAIPHWAPPSRASAASISGHILHLAARGNLRNAPWLLPAPRAAPKALRGQPGLAGAPVSGAFPSCSHPPQPPQLRSVARAPQVLSPQGPDPVPAAGNPLVSAQTMPSLTTRPSSTWHGPLLTAHAPFGPLRAEACLVTMVP